ncbi:thioesterase [Sphingomonas sp. HMWF008]|nr:thioesterase [Sphingomonas sp. HMWF008]
MTFTRRFTATPADIDELGHVNNAVWVRWIQELAVAHWAAVASAEQQMAYVWVVTRHEIDYRGNVAVGETVTGETWVPEPPKGARFDRHVRFTGSDGRAKVEAVTTWALLDRVTGRLLRVRPEIAAPFLSTPMELPRAPGA